MMKTTIRPLATLFPLVSLALTGCTGDAGSTTWMTIAADDATSPESTAAPGSETLPGDTGAEETTGGASTASASSGTEMGLEEPDLVPIQWDDTCESTVFVGRVESGCVSLAEGQEKAGWVVDALGTEGVTTKLCRYQWDGEGSPYFDVLQGVAGLAESCPKVRPQGPNVEDALQAATYDAFMARIGRRPLKEPKGKVDLYLIDTVPETLAQAHEAGKASPKWRERHGLTERELLHEMLFCANKKTCPVKVHNTLGLPRYKHETLGVQADKVRGGTFGHQFDLAEGIHGALLDWAAKQGGTYHSRLVLTLAVGWEPRMSELAALKDAGLVDLLGPDSDLAVEEQAVLATLTQASCRGALIVAAAGNATSEPCAQTGMTGPALLQALAAPDPSACNALDFTTAAELDDIMPLVSSVTHVGYEGLPLPSARVETKADFAAQGVAVGRRVGGNQTLVGSSVAATVGAGAAAALWAQYPQLTRAEVLKAFADGGLELMGPLAGTREISMCGALRRVCHDVKEKQCDLFFACPSWDEEVKRAYEAQEDLLAKMGNNTLACTKTDIVPLPAKASENKCGGETQHFSAMPLPDPLPGPPPVLTQPGTRYCPTCFVKATESDGIPLLKVRLRFDGGKKIETNHPLVIGVQSGDVARYYAVELTNIDWEGENLVSIRLDAPLAGDHQFILGYYLGPMDATHFGSEPLLGVPERCGDSEVQSPEACDDGNPEAGDGCEPDCTATVYPDCNVPDEYVVCDAKLDLDTSDTKAVLAALGICNQDPKSSVLATDFYFGPAGKSKTHNTWQLARGFGTYTHDHDKNPQTQPVPFYGPREGQTFLVLSTGEIAHPDADGLVIEAWNSQELNHGNNNSLSDLLPTPIDVTPGSAVNQPFEKCDGVGDCSLTLQSEWTIGKGNPENRIFFGFNTRAPEGAFGYSFDFAFCTSEGPFDSFEKEYNDLFIAFQLGSEYTGNVALIKGLPASVNALNPYLKFLGYSGEAKQLAGTGFEGHACTAWTTARGKVVPNEEITLAFYLADMANNMKASVVLLDNFRWSCAG